MPDKPKPLKELLDQTDSLISEADWHAPIAEDGGNIEDNYNEMARRLRRLQEYADNADSSSRDESIYPQGEDPTGLFTLFWWKVEAILSGDEP